MEATTRKRNAFFATGLTYTICWMCAAVTTPAVAVHIAGDINESGVASAADGQLVVNASNGETVIGNTDIDYSGTVDLADILLTLDAALGLAIDSDGDGLADAAEANLHTSPDDVDTDKDTLSDYDEVAVHHTDPLVPNPVVQSFGVNGRAIITSNRAVTIETSCTGAPVEYRVNETPVSDADPWQPYAPAPSLTLSAGGGMKTVYLQVRDAQGVLSPAVSDSIVLDEELLPTETRTYLLPGNVPLDLLWIPAGTFYMGANDVADPVHLVELTQGFWMARYETTQEQWRVVMGYNPSYFNGKLQSPVERVSWLDCQAFVSQLNTLGLGTFALPTEAQWEYACRASTATDYSFGDDAGLLDVYAWYNANSGGRTRDVCTKRANGFGLYDMHGNVWEWVQDYFGPYSPLPQVDPIGLTASEYAVVRGGCWANEPKYCESAMRDDALIGPGYKYDNVGFRIIRLQDQGLPPVVTTFAINNDAAETITRTVTLDNACSGNPTHYKASESPYFEDAAWQPYAGAPSFTLSFGNETKVVYFKVKDADDRESLALSDEIQLNDTISQTITISLPNSITLDMVWIPRGTFAMGQTAVAEPVHQVTLSHGFYLGTREVTQEQWQAVMGTTPSAFYGAPQHPVEQVSWDDCQAFIAQLNTLGQGVFTLPAEAQWEYACRARTTTAYSFGDAPELLDAFAWYEDNSPAMPAQAGQKQPNPWGLFDIHGNVWEWVQDYWAEEYAPGAQIDPTGPATGLARVVRGGSWNWNAAACRSAYRFDVGQDGRYNDVGFRLCRQPD